jgi:hypothetical protein
MPPLLAPLITALAVGGSAASAGEAIAGFAGGGGGGSQPTPPPPELNYIDPSQLQNILSSVGQNLPGIEANAGGGLSPNAAGAVSGASTGNANDIGLIQQAVNQWLGQNNSGAPAPGGQPQATPENLGIQKFIRGLNTQKPGLTFQNPF